MNTDMIWGKRLDSMAVWAMIAKFIEVSHQQNLRDTKINISFAVQNMQQAGRQFMIIVLYAYMHVVHECVTSYKCEYTHIICV